MEKEVEILLGKFKHVKSVNVDNVDKIQLINRESELTEYDVYSNVNASETYVTERERNAIYRIYGRIDYVSMLNGLKLDYKYTTDYYEYRIDNSKNIFNSFKFYVVKPSDDEYVSLYSSDLSIKKYIRKFEVIATPNNIDIYPAGFTNNIFGKQVYAFNVNIDIDVREMYDYLGFPLTELYLMPCYIKKSNGFNTSETISGTTWESNGIEKKMTLPSTFDFNFNVGDVVETNTNQIIGDLVYYNENEFKQNINSTQTLYIKTYHKNSDNQNSGIVWKYNPLIPLRLRYLSNDLSYVSSASTSYDDLNEIPKYAKLINNGNYIWREIIPQGYVDPIDGIGVDYPFINGKRYLFTQIVLPIVPDMSDATTQSIFNKIWFTKNSTTYNTNITSKNDLDNINKPCS